MNQCGSLVKNEKKKKKREKEKRKKSREERKSTWIKSPINERNQGYGSLETVLKGRRQKKIKNLSQDR